MNEAPPSSTFSLAPVQFSRLTRRGILLGLSLAQLIAVAVAVFTLVLSLYAFPGNGILWTSVLWLPAALSAVVPIAGRKAVEWTPVVAVWAWRSTQGQLRFRRRIERPRPAGTLALPGDAAALREWIDPVSDAVMVHDPHRQTLTAVVAVTHPSFALMDAVEQQRRVAAWGRALAAACRSGRISQIQVNERTLPSSGMGLSEWWARHGHDDGSWAALTYRELIDRAGPAGERHATTISLSLDLKAAARQIRTSGGGIHGAARVLQLEMTGFVASLRAADLTVGGWLTPSELAVVLRSAFDPSAGVSLERHGSVGRSLESAGPVAVTESWDGLRTDTACHAVLWISEWPRTQVFPGFLAPLALSNGVLRTISLNYFPLRADHAARDLRRKKTELISDAQQRRRMGQIDDAPSTAEFDDIRQQEADLTAGHGVLRVCGLISITAASAADLDTAVASVEQSALQAGCETRRLVGQQAQAFLAAALPLCRPI